METQAAQPPREVDLLVIGAGAGGMAAALAASPQGLEVLVCEKDAQVGGTTATSAGTLWIPGSRQSREAGFTDSVDATRPQRQASRLSGPRWGVVLATGGFAHNKVLRDAFMQAPVPPDSMAVPGNQGEGITAAMQIGAQVRPQLPYRGFLGAGSGQWAGFVHRWGLGAIHPGTRDLASHRRAGCFVVESSLEALAVAARVDPKGLRATVERHNRFAQTGVDEDFGKAGSELNRFNGDLAHKPNPCIGTIGTGPYCAMAVWRSRLVPAFTMPVMRTPTATAPSTV